MGILDFKCPICGGDVTCWLDYGKRFASLDFRCCKCGWWVDVDMTPEAKELRELALESFREQVLRIEGRENDS